jgi:RimJ/RimL family protein N-acetyltransferase
MNGNNLTVREIQHTDIEHISSYWLNSDPLYLRSMGVDLAKLPGRSDFEQMLSEQIITPIERKRSYCLIWELDGKPVGHCNTNPITFAQEAFMHLHLWYKLDRAKGIGTTLVKMTLPCFFEHLKLKKLISEPYSLNAAPHRVLEKAGFSFINEYITTPGSINFEQHVKRWVLTLENFNRLQQ